MVPVDRGDPFRTMETRFQIFFHPLVLSGQPANLFVEFLNLSFILLGLSAHFSIFIFKKQVEITGCIGLPSGKHVGMDVVVGSDFV